MTNTHQLSWPLNLDSQTPRTVKNVCLIHPVYGIFLLAACTDKDKVIPCSSTENDFCHCGFRFEVAAVYRGLGQCTRVKAFLMTPVFFCFIDQKN